jgi:hypothetical protein
MGTEREMGMITGRGVATVPHPGRFNNSWEWLKTVSDAMQAAGAPMRDRAWMLQDCEQAYLAGGVDACIEATRRYVTIGEASHG